MAHARSQHPNAPLTPEGRRRMVRCVVDGGWTVRRPLSGSRSMPRRCASGGTGSLLKVSGLVGSVVSAAPVAEPDTRPLRRRVIRLRRERRWGADHIGYEVGLAASTVQNILNRAGAGPPGPWRPGHRTGSRCGGINATRLAS